MFKNGFGMEATSIGIVNWIMYVLFFGIVIVLISGIIRRSRAHGDQVKSEKANSLITIAVIAFVLLVIVWLATNFGGTDF